MPQLSSAQVSGTWGTGEGKVRIRHWATKTNTIFFIVWPTTSPAVKSRLFPCFHGESICDGGRLKTAAHSSALPLVRSRVDFSLPGSKLA